MDQVLRETVKWMAKNATAAFAMLAIFCAASRAMADDLAIWTFEANGLPTTMSNAAGAAPPGAPFVADSGIKKAASFSTAKHADASTIWTAAAGNASSKALSASKWAVNDYFQFQTSTVGYSNIQLMVDAVSSGTGPKNFDIQYSTDGTSFTDSTLAYVARANAAEMMTGNSFWDSAGPVQLEDRHSFDLSTITALNNQSAVYFRFIDNSTTSANGATVAPAGTSRVDNVTITGIGAVLPTGVAGDYNSNNVVDAADYTVWRDALGKNITLPHEDPNSTPGSVTIDDYNYWKAHFGATFPGAGGGSLSTSGTPCRSRRAWSCWRLAWSVSLRVGGESAVERGRATGA